MFTGITVIFKMYADEEYSLNVKWTRVLSDKFIEYSILATVPVLVVPKFVSRKYFAPVPTCPHNINAANAPINSKATMFI